MKKGRLIMIILVLLIAGGLLWSHFISTKGLNVREYALENEKIPGSFNGLKIVQLSDLHYGRMVDNKTLEDIAKRINELKPDLIVFTGDLIDKDIKITDKKMASIKSFLTSLDAAIGKYAVKGNHDYSNNLFESIMTESNFKILTDESDLIYYKGDTPIIISGFPSSIKAHPDYDNVFTNLSLTEEELAAYYKVLLVHEPDQILKAADKNFDLVLSGHSHNGQVRLPFIGAIVKTNGAKTYYESYYKVDDADLYISGGVGCSVLNFRFMDKPSFNFYRLYNK